MFDTEDDDDEDDGERGDGDGGVAQGDRARGPCAHEPQERKSLVAQGARREIGQEAPAHMSPRRESP